MKRSVKDDLKELSIIVEELAASVSSMSEGDMIDVAALLKPVEKGCTTIDKFVKTAVKNKLKHKEGSRLGDMFKAVLRLVDVQRLDQEALKEGSPNIHKKYLRDATDERITFELR